MAVQRILIADADSEFRDSVANALRNKGFAITTASTGSDALKIIRREKVDLLILDLLVPDMSGEDVSRIIKTDPVLNQIPIIILTSKNDLQTKLKCLEIGVEEYFVKPMETEELAARINRFFKLMNQWKNASKEGSGERSRRRIHSDTTADLVHKTNPTINLPAHENANAETKPPAAAPKAEKSSYGVYRIENIAGSGGMGLVYKAHDQSLDRYVAVKVLSKVWSTAPEFLGRFRKEAMLIAAINHPGIAQIYTFAEDQGESYFALQWCAGGSLANLIRAQGKIELLPAIDIIVQCARALEAASNKGVVHRDIKPSNLMFDENQQVKIVDFGIAQSEKMPEKADRSAVIGSPAYMSPEQGRGANTDHRTDIYSLGITFYQMLYGRLPFSAESPMEYVEKQAKAPFPAYDDLDGKIPPRAYKIIEKMTQKNPVSRYQAYSELNKDLERLRNELYSQRRLKIPAVVDLEPLPKFTTTNLFDLLARIFRDEKSGMMKLSWGSLQKRFLIANNQIVHFESPQQDESCWAVLVNRKLMKKEDVPSAHEDFEESLNRLLYMQAFSPENFKSVWREMMMQSLMQVFLWPVFEGEFLEGKIEHNPVVQIPLSKVLMEAVRSMIPKDAIRSSVFPDRFIVRTPKFEERLRILNLSTDENFLASRVEGDNVTFQTLQVLTGFSEDQVARAVFALERAGVLKYETTMERRPRRTPEMRSQQPTTVPLIDVNPSQDQKSHAGNVEELTTEDRKRAKKGMWLDDAPQPDSQLAARNYEQAQLKYKSGLYSEAARLCGRAIKNNRREGKYHFLLALALTHFPHSLKATVESFRQAVELDQDNVEYRFQFVEFLKKSGLFDQAFFECEKLLEMAPTDRRVSTLLRQIELEK